MSRKILSIVILLIAIVLSGCVTSQIRHPDGRVENRYEILGPSMNYSHGVNRGVPIGLTGGNSVMGLGGQVGSVPVGNVGGTIIDQFGRPIGRDINQNNIPVGSMPNGDMINIHGHRYKP